MSTMIWAQLSRQSSTASTTFFFFILAPTDYQLFLRLSQACLPPSIACRGRRVLSPWRSFVFVPSRPLSHQETHVIRAEGFENLASSYVSCFFQDSPEIHINIFFSQQSFQFFNPSPSHCNVLSKNCFVLATIVISFAFHPLPSSS